MPELSYERLQRIIARRDMAADILASDWVQPLLLPDHQGDYVVRSMTGTGAYWIRPNQRDNAPLYPGYECSCPDFQNRQEDHFGYCKHILAVFLWMERAREDDAVEAKKKAGKATRETTPDQSDQSEWPYGDDPKQTWNTDHEHRCPNCGGYWPHMGAQGAACQVSTAVTKGGNGPPADNDPKQGVVLELRCPTCEQAYQEGRLQDLYS